MTDKHASIRSQLPITQPVDFSLDELVQSRPSGISIVSACMDRNANLLKALRTWVELDEIDEILIVDWSSSQSVYLDIVSAGLMDERVKVLRVAGQSNWVLTHAYNAGFRAASYDKIIKADADIVLAPDFFHNNTLGTGEFIAGNWQQAQVGQEHTNGFFYIHHADLFKANGFNEFIDSYGWDDDDLYTRLVHLGSVRRNVACSSVSHLDHDDASRVGVDESSCENAVQELEKQPLFHIRKNRFIANSMPVWGRRSAHLGLKVCEQSLQYIVARQSKAAPQIVPDHVRQDARYYAAAEIVSWATSRQIYALEKKDFWHFLSAKKMDEMHSLDVSIRLHNSPPAKTSRVVWMLNCYPEVLDSCFNTSEFLGDLNSFCSKNGVNVVARVNNEDFAAFSSCLEAFDHLFAIPVSEAYDSKLTFLTVCDAKVEIQKRDGLRFFASNIRRGGVGDLLSGAETPEPAISSPAIQTPKAKIFIDAQHGLGNRMRAIASAAIVAEQSNRELVVVWQPDKHCEAGMLDLFDYEGALIPQSFVNGLTSDMDLFNCMEVEPGANKDAKVVLAEGRDVYVRTSSVLNHKLSERARENQFLKQLRPIEKIIAMTSSFDLANHTGVHIRMEGGQGLDTHSYETPDNWSSSGLQSLRYWREKSHYSNFVARLDKLIAEQKANRFFLATDRAETYETFKTIYGDRMSYLERGLFDRSKEQIQYALADAILLSQCSRFIGSTWSSFSEIAMRLTQGFSSIEMSGEDF